MRGPAASSAAKLGGVLCSQTTRQQSGNSGGGLAALLQQCSAALMQGAVNSSSLFSCGAAPPQAAGLLNHSLTAAQPLRHCASKEAASTAAVQAVQASSSSGGAEPREGRESSRPLLVEHRRRQGRRIVAAAISGGVDSAAAASMMQQQGHEVLGIFMRNWDEAEEQGNQNCSVERDYQDAQAVCRHLGLPLVEVDFVAQYWQRVFQPFLDQYAQGLTPNPDLACNRAIKFDALLRHAEEMGAEALVTGHYARLRHTPGGTVQLLQGLDPLKDQSYFLAGVPAAALAKCEFPLGALRKEDVRAAAAAAGSPSAAKRSSAGICFIGRRSFGDFLSQYVDPVPGRFVVVGGGHFDYGACSNMLAVTLGQRAGIGGAANRMYVVGKDMAARVVYVADGKDHPSLYSDTALLEAPHWVSAMPPSQLSQGRSLQLHFKARYGQPLHTCAVQLLPAAAEALQATAHSRYPAVAGVGMAERGTDGAEGSEIGSGVGGDGRLLVTFQRPMRAITPGQEFVLYDGEVCLGAAPILAAGRSLLEQGRRLPPGLVADDSVHMAALAAQESSSAQAAAVG